MEDEEAHEISEYLTVLFKSKPGLTSADKLYSAARRTARGRELRITTDIVRRWIAGEGLRHQGTRRKPTAGQGRSVSPLNPMYGLTSMV